MMFPTIKIKAVNVELTNERSDAITQKLAPLARITSDPREAVFDVVIRRMSQSWSGDQFCISVRMAAGEQKYYAVAGGMYFSRALSHVRQDLRRAISNSYRTDQKSFEYIRQYFTKQESSESFA